MYAEYYGLREKPFNLAPDPAYFYLSDKHREVLDHLFYSVREREGFAVFTGEVGTGKTTVCRTFLSILPSEVISALVFNPMLSEEELLRGIVQDFGLDSRAATKKELIDQLNEFLLNTLKQNRNAVLIIDEAQDLSIEVLEQIRILSNLETDKEKLLQIILVGQAELRDKLERTELRQLNQRVSIRLHLEALNLSETKEYVEHRLQVAGAIEAPRFTRKALDAVFTYSGGVPRRINLLCDRALLRGFVEQETRITSRMVRVGMRSLTGEDAIGISRRRLILGKFPTALSVRPARTVIGAAAAALLIAGVYYLGHWTAAATSQPGKAAEVRVQAAPSSLSPALLAAVRSATSEFDAGPPSSQRALRKTSAPRRDAARTAALGPPPTPSDAVTSTPHARPRNAAPTAPGPSATMAPRQYAAIPQPATHPEIAHRAGRPGSVSANSGATAAARALPAPAANLALRATMPAGQLPEPAIKSVPSVFKPRQQPAASTGASPLPPENSIAGGASPPATQPPPRITRASSVAGAQRLPGTLARRAFRPDPRYPYTIHLGSYRDIDNVVQAIGALEQSGYNIYIAAVSTPKRGVLFRILVGRYATRRQARRVARKLLGQLKDETPQVLESRRALKFQ